MKPPVPVFALGVPGLVLLDYAGPMEALRLAGFSLHPVACDPRVDTSLGLALEGFAPLPETLPDGALVLVPGCRDVDAVLASGHGRMLVDWLRRVARPEVTIACVCVGALIAARAGLLAGRRCTTHFTRCSDLELLSPSARVIPDQIFVEDGPLLTSAGITAGIDLALHLIARFAGAQVAVDVARALVVYMRRHGASPQLSPWLDYRNHLHAGIHRIQDRIAADPGAPLQLRELAVQAHLSPRHLTRVFRQHTGISVMGYQQRLRLALAQALLAEGGRSMDRVAESVGLGSARALRRLWSRHLPGTPSTALQL